MHPSVPFPTEYQPVHHSQAPCLLSALSLLFSAVETPMFRWASLTPAAPGHVSHISASCLFQSHRGNSCTQNSWEAACTRGDTGHCPEDKNTLPFSHSVHRINCDLSVTVFFYLSLSQTPLNIKSGINSLGVWSYDMFTTALNALQTVIRFFV